MTEPWPLATIKKNLVKIGHVLLEICSWTDRQTWSSQYFASPTGGKVKLITVISKDNGDSTA